VPLKKEAPQKKEAPVPQRKDTPSQPAPPMRKNMIPLASPTATQSSRPRPDGGDRRPVVDIAQFAKEGFNHEECKSFCILLVLALVMIWRISFLILLLPFMYTRPHTKPRHCKRRYHPELFAVT
jgi:hypothetical protein